MSWWWLSFCDPSKPVGQQFLGACVIRGASIEAAVRNAHLFAINPGGEVQGLEIPDRITVPEWAHKRLLTHEETLQLDREIEQQVNGHVQTNGHSMACEMRRRSRSCGSR